MRMHLLISVCLWLNACASTPPQIETVVTQVRPVWLTQDEAFDMKAALSDAQRHYNSENFAESLGVFQQILLRDPSHEIALLGRGNSELAIGHYSDAHDSFIRLSNSDIDPKIERDVQVGLLLSTVLTGKSDNPESRLNDALQLNHRDARVWNALGQLLDKNSQWMRALDNYVYAMKLGGATVSTINNMGMSLLLQGRYAESLDKFEQAVSLEPTVDLYDNNRRLALILLRNFNMAFDGSVEQSRSRLLNDAGYIEMQNQNFEDAQYFFTKAIEVNPSFDLRTEENLHILADKMAHTSRLE